jgi:hypothetical protein
MKDKGHGIGATGKMKTIESILDATGESTSSFVEQESILVHTGGSVGNSLEAEVYALLRLAEPVI